MQQIRWLRWPFKMPMVYSSLLLTLLLPFQNCSQVKMGGATQSPSSSPKPENNGAGYSGKPDYYRFVPGFTCESKESPVASVHFTPQEAVLTENKKLICAAQVTSLPIPEIDTSIFQTDIVGYREGIFEGSHTVPSTIPSNLVEIWCRDQRDESGIETITHYDRSNQQAVTRIYYANALGYQMKPDFSVARIVSSNRVTVQDSSGFKLQVFRDQPDAQIGLFKGRMNAVIDGQAISRDTSCRLGGSVDPKVWPVRQVVDLDLLDIKFAPDFSSFSFTSRTGSQSLTANLYFFDLTGENQKLVTPPLATGVPNFVYTPDLSALLYWGDPQVNGGMNLFRVPLTPTMSPILQLYSNPVASYLSSYNSAIKFSNDGQRALVQDGSDPLGTANYQIYLKSVPVGGGIPTVINPPITSLNYSDGAFTFEISQQANRVAFLFGGYWPDLYIADVDGNHRVKPNTDLTSLGLGFARSAQILIPAPGRYAFVEARERVASLPFSYFQLYAVSMDGARVVPLKPNTRLVGISRSGEKVLLMDVASDLFTLFDLTTLTQTPIDLSRGAFFSKDADSLIGPKNNGNGTSTPSKYSFNTGRQDLFCPVVSGSSLKIIELDNQDLVMASYNSGSGIYTIFTQSPGYPCVKRNSFPAPEAKISKLSVSPNQRNALVQISGPTLNRIIFVPLNGQPALQVNFPSFQERPGQTANLEAHFLPDSNSIFYFGNQIEINERHGFLWRSP